MADRNQIADLFRRPDPTPPPALTIPEIRVLLQKQANIIVSTGTGGPSFNDKNPEYIDGDLVLNANFKRLGLPEPFPWRDLWDWHGYYSTELPTYQSRRVHVRDLVRAALDGLAALESPASVVDPGDDGDPTWESINIRVTGLVAEISSARDKDTWQDAGRRSREILIDLGKLIADPTLVPAGQEPPKGADARGWFDMLLASRAAGSDKKELRGMMRSTWDLAQKVTHGDISHVDAFASAQATILLVRTVQMLLNEEA